MLRILAFPKLVLGVWVSIFLLCAWLAPQIRLAVDGAFLRTDARNVPGTPTAEGDLEWPDTLVVIAIQRPQNGAQLRSVEGFNRLVALHDGLERTVSKHAVTVRSVVTVARAASRYLEPAGSSGASGWALDHSLTQIVLNQIWHLPFVTGVLIGFDERAATFLLELPPTAEREAVVEKVRKYLRGRQDSDFTYRLGGQALAEITLGRAIISDILRLAPVLAVVVFTSLWLSTRSLGMAIISLTTMAGTALLVSGTMVVLDLPVSLLTTVVPAILLSIGITDQINLMYHVRARTGVVRADLDNRIAVIRQAVCHVLPPMVASSTATGLAFASFITATSVPLREFGVTLAVGTVAALALSCTLTPVLLVMCPLNPLPSQAAAPSPRACRTSLRVLAMIGALATIGFSVYGTARLQLDDSWVDNFPKSSELTKTNTYMNSNFVGAHQLEVVLEGPSGFFADAASDVAVGHVARLLRDAPGATRVISVADVVRFRSTVLDAAVERKSAEFQPFVSFSSSQSRILVFVREANFQFVGKLVHFVEKDVTKLLEGSPVRARTAGAMRGSFANVQQLLRDELLAVPVSLFVLICTGLIFLRSVRLVAYILTPVAGAIIVTLGVMGYLSIPIGLATGLFASLTLGVGVDFGFYTVYWMKRAEVAGEPEAWTARAIRSSALFLVSAFAVLLASDFPANRNLGMLLAVAATGAYLFSLAARAIVGSER